jgi:CRP-like cAMP-binding protein
MEPDEARRHLRTIELLEHLPEGALDRLIATVDWIEADRETEIVGFRDKSDATFFIVNGACRVKLATRRDKAVVMRRLERGSHFGEIAALTGDPRTVSVVAEAGCLLAKCPRSAFEDLMVHEPAFAKAVAVSLARMVGALTERVFELAALQVAQRLHAETLRLAKSGARVEDAIAIRNWRAGIGSTQDAARALTELEERKVVKTVGRTLLILDIETLRQRADGKDEDVCADLLRLAESGETVKEGVLIKDWPTHEILAATIGSTREAITRELGDLAEDRIILQEGRTLLVLDMERLCELVRSCGGLVFDDEAS